MTSEASPLFPRKQCMETNGPQHIHFVRDLLFDAQCCAWPAGDHQSPRPCSCTQASHHSGSPKGNAQHLTTTAKSRRHAAVFFAVGSCGKHVGLANSRALTQELMLLAIHLLHYHRLCWGPWRLRPTPWQENTRRAATCPTRKPRWKRHVESGKIANRKATVEERA